MKLFKIEKKQTGKAKTSRELAIVRANTEEKAWERVKGVMLGRKTSYTIQRTKEKFFYIPE